MAASSSFRPSDSSMAVRHLGGSDRAKIRHIEILGVGLGPTGALGLERLRTDEEDARLARRVLGADVVTPPKTSSEPMSSSPSASKPHSW